MSLDERLEKLKEVYRGWINSFKYASMQNKLIQIDGWLRNRIRYCIWHYWNRAIASS
jgi:RNA-directed DNA polymerase